MPSFISANYCICQQCKKKFLLRKQLSAVINLSFSGFEKDLFFNQNLNQVCCPYCKTEFTYEIPMIIFDIHFAFAVLVQPNLREEYVEYGKNSFLRFLPKGFQFRTVYYQIEALEKVRSFYAGIDDRLIECCKLKAFSQTETTPFGEINMIFSHADGNKLYFDQYDCNNHLLGKFRTYIPIPGIIQFKPLKHGKRYVHWYHIDRLTIIKHILGDNNNV